MRGRAAQVGSTHITPNGYHYTRSDDKWVLTHRLMMEKELGRPLRSNERVIFRDGDKTNITLENLRLVEIKGASKAKRIANLRAKIDELQAELEELEA